MDKEELKKLAQNPNNIPGIYNYCDRWCERCSFTSRCLNYAMREEDRDDPNSSDIESKAFWKKIEESLTLAMEMLQEMAEEQGIDLSEVDVEEATREHERTREAAESHELSQSAHKYADLVDSWFNKNQDFFKQREKDLKTELSIGLEQKKLVDEAKSIVDATEVISWYQHQIYVKIMRALTYPEIDEEFEDEIQNDSNGSAKVALIGMDRSIGAWARLHEHFPDQTDEILDILLHLDRLRKKTAEKTFPNARAFKRPGFDTMNNLLSS
jgi:glutaredoxin